MPTPPGPRAAGRQKDPAIDAAVRTATLDLLAEVGYADFTIGQLAKNAGVYRPAVYRRWPSKQHLVVDAVADLLGTVPTVDTGNLREDLITGIETLVTAFETTVLGHVLPALVADLARDPVLRDAFLDEVFHARRRSTEAVLRHAAERGVIPELDGAAMDFALDALAAPVYYRALFRHAPLNRTLVENSVDLVLAGLAARAD
ncbi:TetR/AcrR family transcriptional regulator [Yinghuangia sp. YIM S10712]|uniref:TetR/AcrR family transcriptional regulator n=1 Tax=Yinghuangia sp. YIM S10712 TaxID=3436930 RepID=UPI003F52EE60